MMRDTQLLLESRYEKSKTSTFDDDTILFTTKRILEWKRRRSMHAWSGEAYCTMHYVQKDVRQAPQENSNDRMFSHVCTSSSLNVPPVAIAFMACAVDMWVSFEVAHACIACTLVGTMQKKSVPSRSHLDLFFCAKE